ncbi:MAG: spore germination protein [Clostridiales bacterium]|nr:spore germination protein [Clostridiales bacterium]
MNIFTKWLDKGWRKKKPNKPEEQNNKENQQGQKDQAIYERKFQNLKLTRNLQDNITNIKNAMNNNFDIKTKEFKLRGQEIYAGIVYIQSIVNEDTILQHIVNPLMIESSLIIDKDEPILFKTIIESMVTAEYVKIVESLAEIILAIMSGDTLLCIQGYDKGFIISTRKYVGRQVGEPVLEPSVQGSQEGFTETIRDNIGLIRRRLRDPNLVFNVHKLGRRTKLEVVVIYIKDIVDQNVVDEVNRRISSLDIDGVHNAAQLGLHITDSPNSIFPLFQLTERPDRTVRGLLEGRVAILIEGGGRALLVPVTLPLQVQSVDDYYENWIVGSILRISRYLGLFVSSFLPALYIAVTSHHPGMLPTILVLTIAGSRAGMPFPGIFEAIIMEVTIAMLQEASIRLPRVVGQTVSIVGGLVIGQAAVQAGIVGPIMVIITALTAIGSFTIPDYSLSLATRAIRIPFMILAATLGIFGVSMGMLLLLIYIADLKSFGVRYIRPLSPYRSSDLRQTFISSNESSMTKRPVFLNPGDKQRQSTTKRGGGDAK